MFVNNSIKKLRLLNGIEQKKLAAVLGVTAGCVCAWEIGRNNISIKYIKKLAEIFDCSEEDIMTPDDLDKAENHVKDLKKYDLKNPSELKEDFEALEMEEQNALLKNYEALGLEVIKQQCSAYKSLYRSYKDTADISKKDGLYFSLLALERWFRQKLHRWVVTEIECDDLFKRLKKQIDKEPKGKYKRRDNK